MNTPKSKSVDRAKPANLLILSLFCCNRQFFEFRHKMVLDDQEKELRDQLAEKQQLLKTIRPTTAKMRKDQHEIKLLENKLETALTKYNDLQA
jgi:hypothetical protein